MPKRKKIPRKSSNRRKLQKKHFANPYVIIFLIVLIVGLVFLFNGSVRTNVITFLTQAFAARPGGGSWSYNLSGGCASQTTRPCYDKLTASGVNLLGKNGQNTFTSCTSNAAANKVGEIIQKTPVCGQEKVLYCHDGQSSNFIRKFDRQCSTEPPPPPQPTPEPTSTPGPTPVTSTQFRITFPNGGEQLPFGSHQVVRWEGGDTISTWPIFLSIIDWDRYVTIREMIIATPNDGQEDWIVDLPPGNYYVAYGQGCRFATCVSASQWDYGNARFSVVAGAPIEKIYSDFPLNQSMVVLSPSGGEVWSVGSTQTIKWSGLTPTSTVRISLVTDQQSLVSIASSTANDGAHQWVVPAFVPPGQYKIFVGCTNCGTAPSGFTGGFYNYSFYPFTIK